MPDLSIVVVSYEMARELPRTLRSLSPAYQGIDAARYEVIVVDNGSRRPPAPDEFATLGIDLSIANVGGTSPSPVGAINHGIARARADLVGVWIDGARLASPGLLRACLGAARLHPRAVVATLNYQLGPELQRISTAKGYDQKSEDGLLQAIGWPADGYRLFDIATSEMPGGPQGPLLESNALFMARAMWDELGGYDPAFDEPGGGMVNPDTLIRALALPGSQLVRVVGEGTFHQFHGGLTTSTQRGAMDVVKAGAMTYYRRRGRPLSAVRQVGWIFDSRRGTALSGSATERIEQGVERAVGDQVVDDEMVGDARNRSQ
ncbi:glycosyltransferase family 2 protein [Reyranella sp.]|uniref:glycosyltransferase family 2 protein n=1 Tax=Reyranella sp. TaxID=1929291 RepID=UPI003BAAADF6